MADPGTESVGQSVAVPLVGRQRRVANLRYHLQTRSSLSRSLGSGLERLPVDPSEAVGEGTGLAVVPFGSAVVESVPFQMEWVIQLQYRDEMCVLVGGPYDGERRLVVLQHLGWQLQEDVN